MSVIVRRILFTVTALAGVIGLLLYMQSLGGRIPRIEVIGPEVTTGPLRIAPIRFAQTDFYVYPTRVDAELGHLSTPLFYQTSRPERVTLRFVRFAATTSHPGPPVVYLAGGPGGSGIVSASGDRFPFFMALREVGDVIALEIRGVGPSSRRFCPGKWSYPLDHELDEALLSRLKGDYLQSCWENLQDPDGLSAFNTRESAADLEDLRIALGAPQLNLVGISHGTHLALAYLRQYPDRVAGAVLAGVEGPDHTYKSPAVVESVIWEIDRTLEEEVYHCRRLGGAIWVIPF